MKRRRRGKFGGIWVERMAGRCRAGVAGIRCVEGNGHSKCAIGARLLSAGFEPYNLGRWDEIVFRGGLVGRPSFHSDSPGISMVLLVAAFLAHYLPKYLLLRGSEEGAPVNNRNTQSSATSSSHSSHCRPDSPTGTAPLKSFIRRWTPCRHRNASLAPETAVPVTSVRPLAAPACCRPASCRPASELYIALSSSLPEVTIQIILAPVSSSAFSSPLAALACHLDSSDYGGKER